MAALHQRDPKDLVSLEVLSLRVVVFLVVQELGRPKEKKIKRNRSANWVKPCTIISSGIAGSKAFIRVGKSAHSS